MRAEILSDLQTEAVLGGRPLAQVPSFVGYLMNLAAGRAATPCSDFYDNMKLDSHDVLIRALSMVGTWTDVPRLQNYEFSRTSKYGPQGFVPPIGSDLAVETLSRYYDPTRCLNPCKVDERVLQQVRNKYKSADLHPLSYDEVIQRQKKKKGTLNTSAGLPDPVKRSKIVDAAIYRATKGFSYPTVLGVRSMRQAVRDIFMAPFSQNLRELRWVYPLMDFCMADDPIGYSAWGGQSNVEEVINQAGFEFGNSHMSTDYSKMDTTVGPAQIAQFYDVIKCAFDKRYHEELKRDLIPIATQPVVIGALKTPGRLPSKGDNPANFKKGDLKARWKLVCLPSQPHGLFSGLGWTNFIETELNSWVAKTLALHFDMHIAIFNGDDGGQIFNRRYDPSQLAESFARESARIGMIANKEKQFVSTDELHYLQRVYSPETVQNKRVCGAYPAVLAFNSAKNPERNSYLTGVQRAVRLIEIAENCAGHPKFLDIAHNFVLGSPILQEARGSNSEFWKTADSIFQEQVEHGTLEGSNLKGGLHDFEFVKLLRSGRI